MVGPKRIFIRKQLQRVLLNALLINSSRAIRAANKIEDCCICRYCAFPLYPEWPMFLYSICDSVAGIVFNHSNNVIRWDENNSRYADKRESCIYVESR